MTHEKVPGLLDAQEIAKLEGLSGEWREIEGDTLVHNPQVERDTPSIDF